MYIELGSIPDWIAAIGSIATAVVAWWAFLAWRTQLRGASKHAAAAEIAESAQLLRYHFYDARSSLIFAGEFPESYHTAGARACLQTSQRSSEDSAPKSNQFLWWHFRHVHWWP
jgi:hypothetical protein